MAGISQIGMAEARPHRPKSKWVLALAILSALPSLVEAYVLIWGARQGFTGKALRDGLDFWAGGFLALHRQLGIVFNPACYERFVTAVFGAKLPPHMWSYPPSYLLLASGFGWLPPWPAVFSFDAASLLLLIFLLRLARQPWPLVLAVAASPVALENIMEGQNAALMTALIGGGILLLKTRPRLAGALLGLVSIKPQLGLILPFYLLRSRIGFASGVLSALALGLASLHIFGLNTWEAFWHVTRPAMTAVLLTGKPAAFAGGLVSVFAAARPLDCMQHLASRHWSPQPPYCWQSAAK